METKLTILIPVRDEEENVKIISNEIFRKISCSNFEILFVNDFSKDNTEEAIQDLINKYDFVRYVNNTKKGLGETIKIGIDNSKGDIIGILNSDEIYFKNTLNIVNKYFNKYKDLDFLFGSVYKHKLLHGFNPWKINFI